MITSHETSCQAVNKKVFFPSSVDTMACLGGRGISPFCCLIEGGIKGWLMNEMKDLFYYAQILHQGENTTAARVITDTVVVEKIPNLMRAIGYYPSNEEVIFACYVMICCTNLDFN